MDRTKGRPTRKNKDNSKLLQVVEPFSLSRVNSENGIIGNRIKGQKRSIVTKEDLSKLPQSRKRQKDSQIPQEELAPVLPGLSVEEIDRKYEEWMKIAADNKINSTNTWNTELIDYFSELSLFRDGNSINFQKASCTLDNCIKVYTSRVDSVVSETGILLNGLSESSVLKRKELEEEFDDFEKPSKKTTRSEQTLAKDVTVLNAKNIDSDFSVDPLFKKTSADFDEGGARGLLLSNLITRGDGCLIFDASDANMSFNEKSQSGVGSHSHRTKLDLEPLLRNRLNIFNQELCPSLRNFAFGSSLSLDTNGLKQLQENTEETDGQLDIPMEYDDFFENSHELDTGFASIEPNHENFVPEILPSFDNELEKQASPPPMTKILADTDNIYSYLDDKFAKNWAGPEHWKLKPRLKDDNKEKPTPKPKPKVEKQLSEIDFLEPEKINIKNLFSKEENLILTRRSDKIETLLPFDHQFSSKDFLSLFNKPTYMFKPKSSLANTNENPFDLDGIDSTLQMEFAAPEAPHDYDPSTNMSSQDTSPSLSVMDVPDTFTDGNLSFLDKQLNSNNFGDQLMPSLKKIQSVRVNYMKIAKNVDVKLLKTNIWNKLSLGNATSKKAKTVATPLPSDLPQSHDFSSVVRSLSSDYKKKSSFNDLSVPFCFICLLHLANEHNLEISDNPEMTELVIRQEGQNNSS